MADGKVEKKTKLSRNKAIILEEDVDESSGYTLIYLTSVVHSNEEQLRSRLKHQFSLINTTGRVTLDEYKRTDNIDNFDEEVEKINFEQTTKVPIKDMFVYAVGVGWLTVLIQFAFLITIIKEYFHTPLIITDDPEVISLRLLSFVTISLNVWIEFKFGKQKLNHAIYQGFMYQSENKRYVTACAGIFQMLSAILVYNITAGLIARSENVWDCVLNFASLIVITELDDWIGDYFINFSKDMTNYTRDYYVQIWCIDIDDIHSYTIVHVFEDAICLIAFMLVLIPIYHSIAITE